MNVKILKYKSNIINLVCILHVAATICPSSRKCLTKDEYIEKLQKFVNQWTNVKYCCNKVWIKIRIKIYNRENFVIYSSV